MGNWHKRVIGALVVALLPWTATAATDATVTDGDTFPDFSLARSDGSTWRLQDHAGKPKIVMFWAT